MSQPDERTDRPPLPRLVVIGCLVATGVLVALIGRDYLADSGYVPNGSGSSLIESRAAQRAVLVAGLGVGITLAALLVRSRRSRTTVAVMCGLGLVLGLVGTRLYPSSTNARLVVLVNG